MIRFKSLTLAQRFLTAHAAVSNLFNLGRPLVKAQHHRDLRASAFGEWTRVMKRCTWPRHLPHRELNLAEPNGPVKLTYGIRTAWTGLTV
jgi:putative transposase